MAYKKPVAAQWGGLCTLHDSDPKKFAGNLGRLLGLGLDSQGNRILKDSEDRIDPRSIPIQRLAQLVLGVNWHEGLQRAAGSRGGNTLFDDAAGGAVTPSTFNNISGWNPLVGGLLMATMMDTYQSPQWIGDSLMSHESIPVNGGKAIGIGGVRTPTDLIEPGMAIPTAGLTEMWVNIQQSRKKGLTLKLTVEAQASDISGRLAAEAQGVAEGVRRQKEYIQAATVLGTVNTYQYKVDPSATPNPTYQASGVTPTAAAPGYNYVNQLPTGNDLVNTTQVDLARGLLTAMRHPETGEPIVLDGTDLLVMPKKDWKVRAIVRGSSIERLTPSYEGVALSERSFADYNPVANCQVHSSPYFLKALTDADKGNVAESTASKYWYYGDFKRAFRYRSILPFTIYDSYADTNASLAEFGVVAQFVCMEFGISYVLEPRAVVQYIGN